MIVAVEGLAAGSPWGLQSFWWEKSDSFSSVENCVLASVCEGDIQYILMQRDASVRSKKMKQTELCSGWYVAIVGRRAKKVLLVRSRRFHCPGFYSPFGNRQENLFGCHSYTDPFLCQQQFQPFDRLNAYTVVFLLHTLSLTAACSFTWHTCD